LALGRFGKAALPFPKRIVSKQTLLMAENRFTPSPVQFTGRVAQRDMAHRASGSVVPIDGFPL